MVERRGAFQITISSEISAATLKNYLSDLRKREDQIYRPNFLNTITIGGQSLEKYQDPQLNNSVRALHKLIFLCGGVEGDIITAKDPWNNWVYTKLHDDPEVDPNDPNFRNKYPVKDAEIPEATSGISLFIQRVKTVAVKANKPLEEMELSYFLDWDELPEVLSEISDIVWNVVHIDELEDKPNFYDPLIKRIAQALGFTEQQILLLTMTKYNHRMVENRGVKNIEEENNLIADLITDEFLPVSNLSQLSETYVEIRRIDHEILQKRLKDLEEQIRETLQKN